MINDLSGATLLNYTTESKLDLSEAKGDLPFKPRKFGSRNKSEFLPKIYTSRQEAVETLLVDQTKKLPLFGSRQPSPQLASPVNSGTRSFLFGDSSHALIGLLKAQGH